MRRAIRASVVGSLAVLFAGAGGRALGQPLGTAFTYQGELRSGGVPASGMHDLLFRLYDTPAGGTPVGTTVCVDNVGLTEGRFTVSLDFGAVYAGQQLFLEIEVRADTGLACGDPTGFVLLSARQALTATPSALFALNAASSGAAATAGNAAQLNGQGASFYQNAANLSSGTISDARLTGNVGLLNGAQTFTGVKTFSQAPSFTASGSPFLVTSTSLVENLNADRLDGLDSTAFLQSIPAPLTLTGDSASYIIRAENASAAGGSTGVFGESTSATGQTLGVYGRSHSTNGRGVMGWATASAAFNYGGYFLSDGTAGRGVYGEASAPTGTTYGGIFLNNSTAGIGVYAEASAPTGATYAVNGRNASTSGRGVFGLVTAASGTTYGVEGQSASTAGRAVFGSATAATGITYGGHFLSASTSGQGVLGEATAATGVTYGGRFQTSSMQGRGVYGAATAGAGNTYGGYFETASTNGHGVFSLATAGNGISVGVWGQSDSISGRGVHGRASAATGNTYGVLGESSSTTGRGVYGVAGADTGTTYAGYFQGFSTSGRGVLGWVSSPTGNTLGIYGRSDSTSGIGVYGEATATSGTIYGVYGLASTAAGGYAVFANGDMGASGLKPFRIDHPDDPASKYLLHYAAESPEVINFYRGTATLDGTGEAVVELPRYFAKINKTPSYQLTAVGAPMPMLHVSEEIDEGALSAGAEAGPGDAAPLCSFRIAGGQPGGKVSWRVEAVRNDLWVRRGGAPVETRKQGPEKGTYQHPELYGQPAEKGLHYDAGMGEEALGATSPPPPSSPGR